PQHFTTVRAGTPPARLRPLTSKGDAMSTIDVATPEPNGQSCTEDGFRPLGLHQVCDLFPEMGPEDLEQLTASVKLNGQKEPIWLHEGFISDGRNRFTACHIAGVKPRFQEWDGVGSLIDFVFSKNWHRRHLTTGQKAYVALQIRKLIQAKMGTVPGDENASAD